jgi:hypothetical protein
MDYISTYSDASLPEFGSLPSAIFFAECFFSGTRQRILKNVIGRIGELFLEFKKMFYCFFLIFFDS